MARSVVTPKHHLVLEVHCVRFREGAAGSQQGHQLHGLHVLHLALPCGGNAAPRQDCASGDEGGDEVFVVVAGLTFIVIGQAAQSVPLDHLVQRHRSEGCPPQLGLFALPVHAENAVELVQLLLQLLLRDPVAQRLQLAHLQQLDMRAEGGRLLSRIGIDI